MAISKAERPVEPEQNNKRWKPILADLEPAADRWELTPKGKEPPPNSGTILAAALYDTLFWPADLFILLNVLWYVIACVALMATLLLRYKRH